MQDLMTTPGKVTLLFLDLTDIDFILYRPYDIVESSQFLFIFGQISDKKI